MHAGIVAAVVAGVIEGAIEWLPVSSKTIITLPFSAVGVNVQSAHALGLIANFGSFFAALWYFRAEVRGSLRSLRHPFSNEPYAQLLRFVVLGTVTTAIVGIPIYVIVQHTFSLVGGSVAMLIIGTLLLATSAIAYGKERLVRKSPTGEQKGLLSNLADQTSACSEESQASAEDANFGVEGRTLTAKTWLITGAAQGLAALPGMSRSAITMTPLRARR